MIDDKFGDKIREREAKARARNLEKDELPADFEIASESSCGCIPHMRLVCHIGSEQRHAVISGIDY